MLHTECSPAEGPMVVLIKQPKPLDYTSYVSGTLPTDAGVDVLNGILDQLADEFGPRVVTVDTSEMNKDSRYFIAANIHPTAAGHRRLAEIVAEKMLTVGKFVAAPQASAPRGIAGLLQARWGVDAEPVRQISDWLLRLEAWRYGTSSANSPFKLGPLQREFRQLRWPQGLAMPTPAP